MWGIKAAGGLMPKGASDGEGGANVGSLGATPLATLQMRRTIGAESSLGNIDEVAIRQVRHDELNNFFRFFNAWKKFALTAPTELPRMPAICSCGRS